MLDEITDLLFDIKSSWDAISQDVIDEHVNKCCRHTSRSFNKHQDLIL